MKRGRIILTVGAIALVVAGAAFTKKRGIEERAAVGAGAMKSLTREARETGAAKSGPRSWQEELPGLQGMAELFGPDSEGRFKAMQDFVERVPVGELAAVLKKLAELQGLNPTVCGRELESRLVRRWADSDPRAAAGWAEGVTGENRGDLLGIAGSSWARVDFAEAAEWAARLDEGEARQKAVASVAYEAIEKDPKAALKLLGGLPAGGDRDNTMAMAVASWANGSPDDAAAWAKQVPEEGLRQQAVSAVALTWVVRDPGAAAKLAIETLPAGELQDHTVLSIARRWAMTQPGEATAWVKRFPDGELREAALESIRVDQERMRGR